MVGIAEKMAIGSSSKTRRIRARSIHLAAHGSGMLLCPTEVPDGDKRAL
jgi:hypothetical protein